MALSRGDRDELLDHGRALALSLGFAPDLGWAMAYRLASAYERWPRRYHDGRHLLACMRAVQEVRDEVNDTPLIAFALWFHDAVYLPWRRDNEQRSADMAARSAMRLNLGEPFARRAHALVMATAHLAGGAHDASDPAIDWVLDIDLGILGTPPEVYDRYEHDVRREYFFVLPRAWRTGRAAVLRHFLDQPVIYRTTHFRDRLEHQARSNLQRSLDLLSAPR